MVGAVLGFSMFAYCSRPPTPFLKERLKWQRILSPFERILPNLAKRDELIFTGLAVVKVTLRPVKTRDRMSSS